MVKFGFRKARFMCVLALFVLLQGCAVQQLNSAIMSGANPVSNQLIRAAKNDGSLNSIDAQMAGVTGWLRPGSSDLDGSKTTWTWTGRAR
jgi:hypothetical protein